MHPPPPPALSPSPPRPSAQHPERTCARRTCVSILLIMGVARGQGRAAMPGDASRAAAAGRQKTTQMHDNSTSLLSPRLNQALDICLTLSKVPFDRRLPDLVLFFHRDATLMLCSFSVAGAGTRATKTESSSSSSFSIFLLLIHHHCATERADILVKQTLRSNIRAGRTSQAG